MNITLAFSSPQGLSPISRTLNKKDSEQTLKRATEPFDDSVTILLSDVLLCAYTVTILCLYKLTRIFRWTLDLTGEEF